MPVTFSDEDWAILTGHDKRAIEKLSGALYDFEPTAKFAGFGEQSAERLVSLGLAESGPTERTGFTVGYRLSKKGWLALEWTQGRRTRVYPE